MSVLLYMNVLSYAASVGLVIGIRHRVGWHMIYGIRPSTLKYRDLFGKAMRLSMRSLPE